MIPYMVGKLAPNSSHFTRGLVKSVPGRSYFRAVPFQNGEKIIISPPRLIVELVSQGVGRTRRTRCSYFVIISFFRKTFVISAHKFSSIVNLGIP